MAWRLEPRSRPVLRNTELTQTDHMKTLRMLLLSLLPTLLLVGAPFAEDEGAKTVGDPYTLSTCPVSGEVLGSMGDAIKVDVDGREVLVCCKGCVKKVKADPKYLAEVDKQMIADQKAYYPTKMCIVSDELLEEEGDSAAIDVIVRNRLFRVCCAPCTKSIKKDPAKYFAILDAEAKKVQGPNYPLTTCITTEKSKLGSMGDPLELVVASRLVKFCCGGCKPKFAKDPAAHLAKLDKAWKDSGKLPGLAPAKAAEHKPEGHGEGHGDGHGGDHGGDGHGH